MKYDWKCPKCKVGANDCGTKPTSMCDGKAGEAQCMGFICECEHETDADHGTTLRDPCRNANCYHCGWGGTYPKQPKGLKAWEKKALEAGWTMPVARKKELGL
jgi:hypothetical protein